MTVESQSSILFTDGACSGNPGPGGWGAVILTTSGRVIEIGGAENPTTNNRMELTAVCEALSIAKRHDRHFKVYTDSSYVLRGITEWVAGWQRRGWKTMDGANVANQDLWQQLLQLSAQMDVQWNYVRGHKGVGGNERCDEIAVGFSQGTEPILYDGDLSGYAFDLSEPPFEEIPKPSSSSGKKKEVHSYLSLVDGRLQRHSTWGECEARVKGRKGARFKKAFSAAEEAQICTEWGLDPSVLTRI